MKTLAVVDVNGLIVNRVVVDDISTWSAPAGFTTATETSPMQIGATYINGVYTPLPTPPTPPPNYTALATAALLSSDMTALRCFKAGVPFPPEWQSYVASLRSIEKSGTGPLPTKPAFPAGT